MKAPVGKPVAIKRAKDIYRKFFQNEARDAVDLDKLAKQLGIEVLRHDLPNDDSGLLLVKDNKALIIINKIHSKNRQRFSLAHELAHYFLHSGEGHIEVFHRDQTSSQGTSRIETEANAFAAEILMPEDRIREWAMSVSLDLFDDNVEKLIADKGKKLGVSPQALNIRLERLGLFKSDYFSDS
jgi:Zn-dependent peptidase ImmA (M78 family)